MLKRTSVIISLAVISLFFVCSGYSEDKVEMFQHLPELSCEFDHVDEKIYLGNFYGNQVYVESGDPRLKDAYVIRVFVSNETNYVFLQRPDSQKLAVYNLHDPNVKMLKMDDLDYKDWDPESIVAKTWLVATGEIRTERVEKGRSGEKWAFVERRAGENYTADEFYVNKNTQVDPKTGLKITTGLVINEQVLEFYYDLEGKNFAPVVIDVLGMQTEERVYRRLSEEGVEKVIWNYIQNEYLPKAEEVAAKAHLEECERIVSHLQLDEWEIDKCVENEQFYHEISGKSHRKYLKEAAVLYSDNLHILNPIEADKKAAVPIQTVVKRDTSVLLSFDLFQDIEVGTVLSVDAKVKYRTDREIKEEWDNNPFSYDDRIYVELYKSEDSIGTEVGGGEYLMTQKQIAFLDEYCWNNTYESMCSGTAYFKVAPTTSYENNKFGYKNGFIPLGLQFVGAEFGKTTYDRLVEDMSTFELF